LIKVIKTSNINNAVRQARTPNFDRLWASCPHASLRTSGSDVGLPDGQMGNSEVGHLNIGAGRVVVQDLPRIDAAFADGTIAASPALAKLVEALRQTGGTCHLIGLVSPGGVHSHQNHGVALARLLAGAGIPTLVHTFLDGRDTPPRSAQEYMAAFRATLPASAHIATVSGRYYAMDRDKRWERVHQAWETLVLGEGGHAPEPASAIDAAYQADISDEFVHPTAIAGYRGMQDGDAILCFNFRADRVREILSALLDPGFTGFPRSRTPKFCAALGMTRYSDDLARHMDVIMAAQSMEHLLGQVVAASGRTQLRMAETEKYPHVTYFLNGGIEDPNPGEERIMVPSPKVATYDLQPEMSAPELTDKAVAAIDTGRFDLIVLNFANPDMVGHTGSLPAAVRAVETVDTCLGRIAEAVAGQGGALLVTADHGNCEMMRDPNTGGPHTAHTTNPVPVFLTGTPKGGTLRDGRLADIAPTLLALMRLPQPAEMTGHTLLDAPMPTSDAARDAE
jgi:2,3-bisphosphoglycerate-independent phosphoglycerate mutase